MLIAPRGFEPLSAGPEPTMLNHFAKLSFPRFSFPKKAPLHHGAAQRNIVCLLKFIKMSSEHVIALVCYNKACGSNAIEHIDKPFCDKALEH